MKSLMAEPAVESGVEEGAGWGDDDDLEVDSEEKKAEASVEGEVGWDVEDADLEIPDLGSSQQAETSESYIHLPTQGKFFSESFFKGSIPLYSSKVFQKVLKLVLYLLVR